MISYLKIIRPLNLGIIALTQLLLHYCIVETFLGLTGVDSALAIYDMIFLILATLLVAAGGYVINDYFDIEADTKNKPEKRIAGKIISLRNLLIYYWVLTPVGVLLGFYLAVKYEYLQLGFIFPVVAIFLWLYSSRYQKTVLWGNLIIACLSAMVILTFWLFEFFALKAESIDFVDALKQISYLHVVIIGYALFAFFVSLVREIVKDVEDMDGDQPVGSLTLAITYGLAASKRLAIIVHVLAMLLLAICQYYLYIQDLTLVFWYLTIAVQLLFIYVLFQLAGAKRKSEFHFLSNAYKLIMLAGILSMQLFYISY